MPIWTTDFGTVPATTGLLAAADPSRSAVVLSWDTTALGANLFWRYYVYRRGVGGQFERIGEVAVTAPATYTDTEAPHGITAEYLVSTSDGATEGEADLATAFLDLRWWIVHPTDPGLTFEIRYVTGSSEAYEYDQDEFRPVGRSTPLVVSGELIAPSGTVNASIRHEDRAIFDLIRRAAMTDPWVVLKNPFGDVLRVKLGNLTREAGPVGSRPVTFAYRTVA